MPIMPALSASSPIMDSRRTGTLDNRMHVYQSNCALIPSVTGLVIPEAVFSADEYQSQILQRMYRDIAPFDPGEILQDEWLNARGAIARFDRNTIEVRVLDVQECPAADLAIICAITGVLRGLCEEKWVSHDAQCKWTAEALRETLLDVIRDGEDAFIKNEAYTNAFGVAPGATAGTLWRKLANDSAGYRAGVATEVEKALGVILEKGTLATRIVKATGRGETVTNVYRRLCDCLAQGTLFTENAPQ
jgi:carboxylate-amine ligase